jgi:hypothetical protein
LKNILGVYFLKALVKIVLLKKMNDKPKRKKEILIISIKLLLMFLILDGVFVFRLNLGRFL